MPDQPTRVLVADDHLIMRTGLCALLKAVPGCEVVAQAADGRQAVDLAALYEPDVVLMDLGMPALDGIAATCQILAAAPLTRIIMLSAHSDALHIRQAFEAGAAAYLLKESAFTEVVEALESVRKGVPFVSWQIPAKVKETLQQTAADAPPLTVRECQVLKMIADGVHSKQMALQLGISDKTIQAHRCNLMAKLNIFSVAELTKYAIRNSLSSLD